MCVFVNGIPANQFNKRDRVDTDAESNPFCRVDKQKNGKFIYVM